MSTRSSASTMTSSPIPTFPSSVSPSAPPDIVARPLKTSFNEAHIVAITQAIAEYPQEGRRDRPAVHRPRHPLSPSPSEPAWKTAIEVLVANGVTVRIDSRDDFTPTPVVSQAILTHNRAGAERHAAFHRRRPGRRHRRDPVAQPADRRRLQVRSGHRRPGSG